MLKCIDAQNEGTVDYTFSFNNIININIINILSRNWGKTKKWQVSLI